MPKFCSECGSEIKDGDFCPNCGKKVNVRISKPIEEVTYEQLIKEIVYIEENGQYRLSKAKSIGAVLFIIVALYFMMMGLATGPFVIIAVLLGFIIGLIYYCACRGIGYLVRTYVLK